MTTRHAPDTVRRRAHILPRAGKRVVIAGVVLGTACFAERVTLPPRIITVGPSLVTAVRVSPQFGALTIGDTLSLRAVVDTVGTATAALRWTSSDSAALAVSSSGRFRVVAARTMVRACAVSMFDSTKTACALLVLHPAPLATPHVEVTPGAVLLWSLDSMRFAASVRGPAGTSQAVTWSVTDTLQAAVSASGLATTKKAFSARDSVCATAVSDVTLRGCALLLHEPPDPLFGIMFVGPATLTLNAGASGDFYAFFPAFGDIFLALSWNSADTTKVSVDSVGRVTARASTTGVKVCAQPIAKPEWGACSTVVVP